MKQDNGQETLRIDNLSYVKVEEKITCKRANMQVKTKYQKFNKTQFNSKMTALICKLKVMKV